MTNTDAPQATRSTRTLLVVALSGALYGWNVGWDYGAFGILFGYRRTHAVVVVSLVLLLFSFLPTTDVQIGWRTRLMLLMPSLYLAAGILQVDASGIVTGIAALLFLLVLPFLPVVLARLLDIDFVRLGRAEQWTAAAITLAVTLLGVAAGSNHQQMLTCGNFERAGDFIPADCVDEIGVTD